MLGVKGNEQTDTPARRAHVTMIHNLAVQKCCEACSLWTRTDYIEYRGISRLKERQVAADVSPPQMWNELGLTLFWHSKFSSVTFQVWSTLVCQFLPVARFIETSTMKSVFRWYWSQRDAHFFCNSEWRSHGPKTKRRVPIVAENFPVIVRKELTSRALAPLRGQPQGGCQGAGLSGYGAFPTLRSHLERNMETEQNSTGYWMQNPLRLQTSSKDVYRCFQKLVTWE